MAIYFGTERCDGVVDGTTSGKAAVNTYYNSTTGVKIANVDGTDIYSPYEALPDVSVKPYYDKTSGVKIATISGKDVYSPTNISDTTGNVVVGQIIAFPGKGTIPYGWLLCDGSEVSKTTYNDLYQVIRDDYGNASNSNNFVLPKLTDNRYLQGSSTPGTKINAGIPNITGWCNGSEYHSKALGDTLDTTTDGKTPLNGAFTWDISKDLNRCVGNTPNTTFDNDRLHFNAALGQTKTNGQLETTSSNIVYGKSDTVTPKSLTVRYLICWKAQIPTQTQIAMPNWNAILDITTNARSTYSSTGYSVPENGYVLFFEQDDAATDILWTGSINGNMLFYTARHGQNWENTNQQLIPVSEGDTVLTDGSYGLNSKVKFIPCKYVQEKTKKGGTFMTNKLTSVDLKWNDFKLINLTNDLRDLLRTHEYLYEYTVQNDCRLIILFNIVELMSYYIYILGTEPDYCAIYFKDRSPTSRIKLISLHNDREHLNNDTVVEQGTLIDVKANTKIIISLSENLVRMGVASHFVSIAEYKLED